MPDGKVPAWYKQGAIARVASGRERLESSRRTTLAAAIRTAGQAPPSERWFGGDADLTGEVAYASVVLEGTLTRGPARSAASPGARSLIAGGPPTWPAMREMLLP
jgi:hypothetical protein